MESTTIEFPKYYVKYLVKKYMANVNDGAMRDTFRVQADPKDKLGYIVKVDVYQNDEEDAE